VIAILRVDDDLVMRPAPGRAKGADVQFRRVLVLAPHTDDGELGCGGSIARLIEERAEVYYAAFSTCDTSLPPELPKNTLAVEVKAATSVLGVPAQNVVIYDYEVRKLNYVRQEILEDLVRLKREIAPDLTFFPTAKDIHQDHYTVAMEGLRAFKQSTMLAYELPWNNLSFETDAFFPLEERHVARKVDALAAYKSQTGRAYMNDDFIRGLARTRGIQVGAEYAEAFEVVRWVVWPLRPGQ
jgi:LmbE family N-acetylglucosaminyl deacetylase